MFLVVGESLVDLIAGAGSWRFEAMPGGSPLNVAVGIAATGHRVRLASQVGDDLFGSHLRDHLARYEVDTTDLQVAGAATSLAFARLDPDGVPNYDFRFTWTFSGAPPLDGVTCLHTGSLAAVVAPGMAAVRAVVEGARQRGITVTYDPNVRPALMGPHPDTVARIEQMVAATDIVKVSAEDLAWLYPGTPDLAAAGRWARRGPALVVITRGAAGAVGLHGGHVRECAAPAVPVVDTVGAGDAFTAGLLSRLADQHALSDLPEAAVAEALRHATATATAACARRGGVPPTPDAVRALAARTTVRRYPAGPR